MRQFPHEFLFGTGTSAYQIEGAIDEDGKTASIWDVFCEDPRKIYKGQNGKIACDHYHRVDADIELMREVGIDSYRFSISWPRIYPQRNRVNQKGLDFYRMLVYKLKQAGITPVITLYHWDLPQWADDLGGWLNRDSIDWFANFAETMFMELVDEVPYWITHNEPFVLSMLGYYMGLHAPGHTDIKEALIVAHHINLSHGLAVKRFREVSRGSSKIGITLNISPGVPSDDTEELRELAYRADGFVNRWYLEPLFKGTYPQYMVDLYEDIIGPLDFIRPGDSDLMTEPMDFLGVNFYKRNMVKKQEGRLLGYIGIEDPQPGTMEEWETYPDVLLDVLRMIKRDYTDLPLIITENGLGLEGEVGDRSDASKFGTYITVRNGVDFVSEDGRVHDEARIAYVHNHLRQCLDFIEEGGRLEGYFLWSLMDNFEWALGYSKRFGIVYVDFSTLKRTIKDSGYWYRQVIAERGLK